MKKTIMVGGLIAVLMAGNLGPYGLESGVVFGQASYEAPVEEVKHFSYDLGEGLVLEIIEDKTKEGYEKILLTKELASKKIIIGTYGVEMPEGAREEERIHKIQKIKVKTTDDGQKILYIYRDGSQYSGYDILKIKDEDIEKDWLYANKEDVYHYYFKCSSLEDLNAGGDIIYVRDTKADDLTNALKAQIELALEKFTNDLEREKCSDVIYQERIDNAYTLFIVKDQMNQQEKICLAYFDGKEVKMAFLGGDISPQPIKDIYKVAINRLPNVEASNVCVYRRNNNQEKVSVYQLSGEKSRVQHIGEASLDLTTGIYSGNESFKTVLEPSFPIDYFTLKL